MGSTTVQPVRVTLHIDHGVLRRSVKAVLEESSLVEVVENREPAEVLVLDGSTPGPSTGDSVRALRESHPGARLILLSVHEDAAHVWRALEGGAGAYVLADWAGRDLVAAVLAVLDGQVYVSPRLRWTATKVLDGTDGVRQEMSRTGESLRLGG